MKLEFNDIVFILVFAHIPRFDRTFPREDDEVRTYINN